MYVDAVVIIGYQAASSNKDIVLLLLLSHNIYYMYAVLSEPGLITADLVLHLLWNRTHIMSDIKFSMHCTFGQSGLKSLYDLALISL